MLVSGNEDYRMVLLFLPPSCYLSLFREETHFRKKSPYSQGIIQALCPTSIFIIPDILRAMIFCDLFFVTIEKYVLACWKCSKESGKGLWTPSSVLASKHAQTFLWWISLQCLCILSLSHFLRWNLKIILKGLIILKF